MPGRNVGHFFCDSVSIFVDASGVKGHIGVAVDMGLAGKWSGHGARFQDRVGEMTTRAFVTTQSAYLSGDFGRDYATKMFGMNEDDLAAIVGRYVRGKRKGALKGSITWKRCESGGWYRSGNGPHGGCVKRPGERWEFRLYDGSWPDAKCVGRRDHREQDYVEVVRDGKWTHIQDQQRERMRWRA